MMESRPDTRLHITRDEYDRLLNEAVGDRSVLVGFSRDATRMWLEKHPLNDWACELLVEWRGITR